MSLRSTKKIIAGLLEDDFEDEGDFKEIYGGHPAYRTFNLEFDFGDQDVDSYETVVDVPFHLLNPAGEDAEAVERIVKDYAYQLFKESGDRVGERAAIGAFSRDDWNYLVLVEEIGSSPVAEDLEDEEDYKDVWGDPPALTKGMKQGYFVIFSQAVPFSTPTGVRWFLKIGPYTNTVEATRKGRFGIMDQPGVTFRVYRLPATDLRWGAMFDPPYRMEESIDDVEDLKDVMTPPVFYPVYDNFVDKSYSFPDPKLALAVARMKQEGRGVFGVVDEEGNVVLSSER